MATDSRAYRFDEKTLKTLAALFKLLGAGSYTEAVKRALSISHLLATCLQKGEKVMIEDKQGQQRPLDFL